MLVRLPHAKHSQLPNLDDGILSLYPQSFDIKAKIEDGNGDGRPQKLYLRRGQVPCCAAFAITDYNYKAELLTILS